MTRDEIERAIGQLKLTDSSRMSPTERETLLRRIIDLQFELQAMPVVYLPVAPMPPR